MRDTTALLQVFLERVDRESLALDVGVPADLLRGLARDRIDLLLLLLVDVAIALHERDDGVAVEAHTW